MARTIDDCIDLLVKTGKISAKAATQAKKMYQGARQGIGSGMGGEAADAAAALKAAEAMSESALDKQYSVALHAMRMDEIAERIKTDPHSRAAGATNVYFRLETTEGSPGGINVDSVTKDVYSQIMKPFSEAMDKYTAKLAGLKKDLVGPVNMVRELFGLDSGDPFAKAAAKGWNAANDLSVQLAKSVGKVFTAYDDWRIPQFWSSERVQGFGKNQFIRDVMDQVLDGGLQIRDPETGEAAPLGRREEILGAAAQKIWLGFESGLGGSSPFNPEMRIFNFTKDQKGFDAWRALQGKYGSGDDVMQTLISHVNHQSREIALSRVLGPQHRAVAMEMRRLVQEETAEQALKVPFLDRLKGVRPSDIPGWVSDRLTRWFGSDIGQQRLYATASGKSEKVESTKIANIFGGLRQWLVSSQMGSAFVSSVFPDSFTAALAANHVGIPSARLIGTIVNDFSRGVTGAERTELLAQMGFVAHAVSDSALNAFKYGDTHGVAETMGKISNVIIRAQGLHAWDQALRSAFIMEWHGLFARESEKAFADVLPATRKLMENYGFTPEQWDQIRAAGYIDGGAVRFFDSEGIANENLRTRFKSMMYDQMRFAAPGASLGERSLVADLKRGTFMGELARTGMMYKTFPSWMVLTHFNRGLIDAANGNLIRPAITLGGLTMMGMLAMQAKQMLLGKDPRPMNRLDVWAAAAAQGGGLGIFGDLINNAFTNGGQSFAETAAGPVVGLVGNTAKLASGPMRQAYLGKNSTFAGSAIQYLRNYTPGSSLWYTRLATDRLLWDQVQRMVDPHYNDAFRRVRERARADWDQQMWWDKGATAPSRAPDLGAALGR